MLRPTLIFVSVVATIGGTQLFTEPLLFNPGANSIAGGTTGQFQTVAMYLVQQAFTGQRFGYAADDRLGPVPLHRGLLGHQRAAAAPDPVGRLRPP